MKTTIVKTFGVALTLSAIWAGSVVEVAGQLTLTPLTFDENGHSTGYGNVGGGVTSAQVADNLGGSVALGTEGGYPEPNAAGAVTLDYLIPEANQTPKSWLEYGWVVVYAPGTSVVSTGDTNLQGTVVDLIHFDNSHQLGGTGTVYQSMFYYSMEGWSNNLANNWVSSGVLDSILESSNTVSIVEPANGNILYNPLNYFGNGESAPGYNMDDVSGFAPTAANQPSYTYDFISVPEPATVWLVVLGGLTLLFRRRK